MRRSAQGLRRCEKILRCVGSSALPGAWHSAEILCRTYGRMRPVLIPGLEPDADPEAVLDWLQNQPADAHIALVGQEPELGRLLGLLICGRPVRAMGFKRAGACLVRSSGAVAAASFMLIWALTPIQLRAIRH